jgi:Ser/Thr protein kinase RdoA (MazF antagonist)
LVAQNFPVQHSILNETALAEWAAYRYNLPAPVHCRFLRGSMSDAYLVETQRAKYILKIYQHNRHSLDAIQAEVEFINDLLAQGFPLAATFQNRELTYVNGLEAPEGIRAAVLFEFIEGCPPRESNLAHSREFGRLAGRIHRTADLLGTKYARWQLDETYLVEDPLRQMRPWMEHRIEDWEFLQGMGNELARELLGLLPKASRAYGMCHGDLHTGNARVGKDGRLRLFDFDSCGYGWRAFDIGVYHVSYDWMNLSEKTQRKKQRFWEAFLDGYNVERTLSENELKANRLCLPLRHFELMGATIRYWAPQIGSDWINDEYFDRHLAWFREWREQDR